MTYAAFLLLFVVAPLVALRTAAPRWPHGVSTVRTIASFAALIVAALAYTTPWDNYLVASGVWWYGPDRVLATIGWVPVEEYLFFALQPLWTGALLVHGLARDPGTLPRPRRAWRDRPTVALLVAALVGAALLLSGWPPGRYAGLVLAWACPPLAGLWWFVGAHLSQRRGPVVGAWVASTLWLWIADRIAIGAGIWIISPTQTLGINPFGLPIEEALFFAVTNALVIAGLMAFLYGDAMARANLALARATDPAPARG